MISRENYRELGDEEKAQYEFEFCQGCALYDECELVGEYAQFRANHSQTHKLQAPQSTGALKVNVTAVRVGGSETAPLPSSADHVTSDRAGTDVLPYSQDGLKERCAMSSRYIYSIPCGMQRVTEGIGDHYKIETQWDSSIATSIQERWEPLQPVFISAQTGRGKNFFVENELIPYVRELNYRKNTKQRVLILSNRLALRQQIKNRLKGIEDSDDGEGKIYPYKDCADVMTYQSLLKRKRDLMETQIKAQSRYIYVICDEAHFFSSDATFNPHTYEILKTIVELFQDAIRVYMSATPYECLKYIIDYEWKHRLSEADGSLEKIKSIPMAFYHFKRDYRYLDVKVYSTIGELYGRMLESVNQKREKWLVFIDDKEKCRAVKEGLEKYAEEKGSPLVVVDEDSK